MRKILPILMILACFPIQAQGSNSHGVLSGRVEDFHSNPLAFAEVKAVKKIKIGYDEEFVYKTYTDKDGRYSLRLPEGNYMVRTSKDDLKTPGLDYIGSSEFVRIKRGASTTQNFIRYNSLSLIDAQTFLIFLKGLDEKEDSKLEIVLEPAEYNILYKIHKSYYQNGYSIFTISLPLDASLHNLSLNINKPGSGPLVYVKFPNRFSKQGDVTIIDNTNGSYEYDLKPLRIRVRDEKFSPIQGAKVNLTYFEGSTWSYTTDERGITEILVDPGMLYTINVECDYPETYEIDYASLSLDKDGIGFPPGDYQVILHRAEPLDVLITSKDGNPLSDVKVTPFYRDQLGYKPLKYSISDEEGVARVFIDPEKRYAFEVRPAYLSSSELSYMPLFLDNSNLGYEPKDFKVELNPTIGVLITVLNELEEPLREAIVTPYYLEGTEWRRTLSFRTDSRGIAQVFIDPEKRYAYRIEYDYTSVSYFNKKTREIHYMPLFLTNEEKGYLPKNQTFHLSKGEPFKMKVVDERKENVSGAKVTVYYREKEGWMETKSYLTDRDGIAEVFLDPLKRYAFEIRNDLAQTSFIDFPPSFFSNDEKGYAAGDLEFEIQSSKSFTITVKSEDGKPLKGAKIYPKYWDRGMLLELGVFLTNERGEAEISLDPKKRYAFHVECDYPETLEVDFLSKFFDNEGIFYKPSRLDFSLSKTKVFTLRLQDDGNPVPNVRITPYYRKREKWISMRSYITDGEGEVEIYGDPLRRYGFEIFLEDGEKDFIPVFEDNEGLGYNFSNITISLKSFKMFRVFVRNEWGEKLNGAKVTVYYKRGEKWEKTRDFFSKDGVVEIWADPGRRYAFKVELDVLETEKLDYMPLWLDNLGEGFLTSDVEAELSETERFLITLKDQNGSPVKDAIVKPFYLDGTRWLEVKSFLSDEEGIAELFLDPEREYIFKVDPDDPNTKRLDYLPKTFDNEGIGYKPQNLSFILLKPELFKIFVSDEDGNPLKGAKVVSHLLVIKDRGKEWVEIGFSLTDEEGISQVWLAPSERYAFKISFIPLESEVETYLPKWLDNDGEGFVPSDLGVELSRLKPFKIVIRDSRNIPIKGAKVQPKYLDVSSRREKWVETESFLTDEDGVTLLLLDPLRRYAFHVESDYKSTPEVDYMPLEFTNEGRGFEPQDLIFNLAATKPFKIKVKDRNGNSLAGAEVTPYFLDISNWVSTKNFLTDEEGIAQVFLDPERRYAFHIFMDLPNTKGLDYVPLWENNEGEGFLAQDLEFIMDRTQAIKIHVSTEDGVRSPAKVVLYEFKNLSWREEQDYYTDSLGNVELFIDPAGRYALMISYDDPETPFIDYMPQFLDRNLKGEVKVSLKRTQKFTIKVIDERGNPISGAKVYPQYLDGSFKKTIYFRTSEDGIAELFLNPNLLYSFFIECDYKETEGMDYLPRFLDNLGEGFTLPSLEDQLLLLDEEIGERGEIELKRSGEIEFYLFTERRLRDVREEIEVRYFGEPKLLQEEIDVLYLIDRIPIGYRVRLILPVSDTPYSLRMRDFYGESALTNAGLGYHITQGTRLHLIEKEEEAEILMEFARKAIRERKFSKARDYIHQARITTKDEEKLNELNSILEGITKDTLWEKEQIEKVLVLGFEFLIIIQIIILFLDVTFRGVKSWRRTH
ncbi:MAG: carboxypeptidase-like regulatory domain-containing protein [Candidatus Methanofastidiosia archaeon]